MENTDFVIGHIDEEVQVIADQPSVVTNYPANTDFFIENIDSNVISIAHSLNIEASEVDFRPANTDFFIENIDKNVIAIAESMNLSPSEVDFRPANTDFFVENIDKNLIEIAESLSLTPYEVTIRPANTDMFIENIDKNVTLIKGSTNVVTVSGEYININLPDGGKVQSAQIDGNATQTTYSGKNILNTNALSRTLSYQTTSRGITFTLDEDGSITLSGKNDGTGNSTFQIYNGTTPLVLVGGYYVGDLNPSDGVYRAVNMMSYDGTSYRSFRQNSMRALAANNYTIYFQVDNGETTQFSSYKIYPMLEAGTTKSPYEPYVGGIPSPNPDYPQEIQTVTGENVVKVLGKNLFDKDGVTILNAYISGANVITAQPQNRTAIVPLQPNTTYTLSGTRSKIPDTATDDFIAVLISSSTDPAIGSSGRRVGVTTGLNMNFTFTTDSTENWLALKVANTANSNFDETMATIQLELGSQATAYEPYQGQDYEVNLGKNLFDISKVKTNGTQLINNGDGTLTLNSPSNARQVQGAVPRLLKSYCPNLKVGDVVTLNAETTSTSKIIYLGAPASVTWNFGTSKTITQDMLDSSVTWYTNEPSSTATVSNIQIEKGTTASDYAEYFTPIELAKIGTYQDRIYKDGEKWYVEKQIGKVVVDGTESFWSTYLTNTSIPAYNAQISDCYQAPETATPFDGLSDYYSPVSQGRIYAQDIDGVSYRVNRSAILFKNVQCPDITSFKQWLSTHPTTVYYALATPTTTEITDQTLIDQLEALASATLGYGANNIWTEIATGNAMPTLELVIEKY